MAFKGDGGRNRGTGRADSAPGGRDNQRDRDGRGGGRKGLGTNPAINPGNPNITGPNYTGPQGAGTGVNAANPNNEPGARAPKDGGVGGMGWDSDFGPAPSSLSNGRWGSGYGPDITNTKSGVPVDIDKFMHDWADYQGIGYGDLQADTPADQLANKLANFFGFAEKNPLLDKSYNTPGNPAGNGANWGADLLGMGLSLASLGFPALKPVSSIYGLSSMIRGQPLFGTVNLGPSVFGSTDTDTPQTAANPDLEPGGGITPDPVARSRSPDNLRLSGYSGGGYNMGAFGKKATKKSSYLTRQLMAP